MSVNALLRQLAVEMCAFFVVGPMLFHFPWSMAAIFRAGDFSCYSNFGSFPPCSAYCFNCRRNHMKCARLLSKGHSRSHFHRAFDSALEQGEASQAANRAAGFRKS